MIGALSLTPLLFAAVAPAQATDLAVGPALVVNDPFIQQTGLSVSTTIPLAPMTRVSVQAGVYPGGGQSDWKALTQQLIDEYNVSPDISRRVLDGSAGLVIEPVRGPVGPLMSAMALYAGVGFAGTVDDLDALQTDESDPRAVSTQTQIHPALVFGLTGDLYLAESFGFRGRWHHLHYVEAVNGTTLESKHIAQVGLEVVFVFGQRDRDGLVGGAP